MGWLLVGVLAAADAGWAGEVPFGPQQVVSTLGDALRQVVAADVDGDGDLDALAASKADDEIAWFENLGSDDGGGPCGVETTACFGAQQLISILADAPEAVAAGDVDGDGDVDVLSGSILDDKIAWYENLGPDGGSGPCGAVTSACFGPQQVISTLALNPMWVAVGDVDGDGDLDVLSASHIDDKIAWYANLGPASGSGPCGAVTSACFGPQQVISTLAEFAVEVAVGDVDGDGDLDVFSASHSDDKIAWYENLGPASGSGPCGAVTSACFGSQQVISTLADVANEVAVGDMDGDGDLDVLSASIIDDKIAWYENLGPDGGVGPCGAVTSACFGPQHVISILAFDAVSVAVGDVDDDGDLDVLSASQDDDKIAWYENLGPDGGAGPCGAVTSACFGPQQVISTLADAAWSVVVGDVDGDGDLDVLSASGSDDKIAWYENETLHRSAAFAAAAAVSTTALGADRLAAGDLDGDGDVDLVSADRSADDITVHRNDGGSWSESKIFKTALSVASVAVADLDGDGDLDALSAANGDHSVRWHENQNGAATLWDTTVITSTALSANGVFAADLDGDGDPDAVSASTGDDTVAWYENRLDEASSDFGPQQVLSTAADGARTVFAADLDGDGDMDVLSASQEDDKIAWYENGGGGVFQPQQIVITSTADSAQSVIAVDVDGDGDLDVVSGSSGNSTVAWHENDGTGVFPATHVVSATTVVNEVAASDLDRDGDLDLISASNSPNEVAWFENLAGDGSTWAKHLVNDSASKARHAIAADLDGDGAPDLASASFGDDTVAWYRNQGGQFATSATATAQGTVANDQLIDVLAIEVRHNGRDGDGDVELVSFEIVLTDEGATPLASAQANALIDKVRVYADDGSGVFEEGFDSLAATVDTLSLGLEGRQTLAMTDDDPAVAVPAGTTETFFVTLEMTAGAESQTPGAFRVLQSGADVEADDADHDLRLTKEPGAEVETGLVDTELTTASCTAPFALDLESRAVSTVVVCEAGTVVRAGPGVVVTSGGDLTLRAGDGVEIGEGVTAETGTALQVETDPTLLP